MSEEQKDVLFDLLVKKAVYGLDEAEQRELDELDPGTAAAEFNSLEITAAAINVAGAASDEPLPEHLYSKIAADAVQFVGTVKAEAATPWPPAKGQADMGFDTILSPRESVSRPPRTWFEWFGWAAAAAACIVLAVNIWFTRIQPIDQANIKSSIETSNSLTQAQMRDLRNAEANNRPPTPAPKALTPAEMREEMIRSTAGMVKANWVPGNMKELQQITGDVIWSDEKQAGYLRLSGLPVNDATKETYQLWIYDKTQDKATPIDGGTFDINSSSEIVVPINAKLKALGPNMFVITIEKAGGVVVSKREKLAATAKVEIQPS